MTPASQKSNRAFWLAGCIPRTMKSWLMGLGWLTADRVVESTRQSQSAHQRFINSILNLLSLMGKFHQHLITMKCTTALCQQVPFPCYQLLETLCGKLLKKTCQEKAALNFGYGIWPSDLVLRFACPRLGCRDEFRN